MALQGVLVYGAAAVDRKIFNQAIYRKLRLIWISVITISSRNVPPVLKGSVSFQYLPVVCWVCLLANFKVCMIRTFLVLFFCSLLNEVQLYCNLWQHNWMWKYLWRHYRTSYFFFLNGCCWINGDSNDFKAQLHIILHGMDISLLIVMWIWKYIGRHVRLLPVYEKWRFSHFKICHFIFVSMYQFRITPPYQ